MSWPWVSREHYEDAIRTRDDRIGQLEVEKKELREDFKKFQDWTARSSGGKPIYAEDKLITHQPEPEPEPEKDPATEHIPSAVQEAIGRRGPRARHILKDVQAQKDREYAAKVEGAAKAQDVLRLFDQAAKEGELAAVSGNGRK